MNKYTEIALTYIFSGILDIASIFTTQITRKNGNINKRLD